MGAGDPYVKDRLGVVLGVGLGGVKANPHVKVRLDASETPVARISRFLLLRNGPAGLMVHTMSRGLEGQLEVAATEFVRKILSILRNASLADVAGVGVGTSAAPQPAVRAPKFSTPRGPGRPRQPSGAVTATANLVPKILEVLASASGPTPARTIADQLGVSLDALAKPLKQLRDERRIVKQGEKRASKYALP